MGSKVYVLIVRDEHPQSRKVMDVTGFSSFSQKFEYYPMGECRYAYIKGSNLKEVKREVKEKLGHDFQPNLNFVEVYSREWHTLDRRSAHHV